MIFEFNKQMKENKSFNYKEISFKDLLCLGLHITSLDKWSCVQYEPEEISEQSITY